MRGEIRRGYFVQGLSGAQFALPEVVEQLRALRDTTEEAEPVVMNACDPANLDGPAREGSDALAFTRVPSTWLVQVRGLPARRSPPRPAWTRACSNARSRHVHAFEQHRAVHYRRNLER